MSEINVKATIVEATYFERQDTVMWKLATEDGKTVSLAFLTDDLLQSLGVMGRPSPERMHQFCKNMAGKQISWSSTTKGKLMDEAQLKAFREKEGASLETSLAETQKVFDEFPFKQVYEIVKEQEGLE